MADDKSERTEKPTGKRLNDARQRGQIARSHDLVSAAALGATLMIMGWAGSALMVGLREALTQALSQFGTLGTHEIQATEITAIVVAGAALIARLAGPFALASAATVLLVSTMQGGWNIASEALTLNFGRLNPANGIKKLGMSTGGFDTLKTIVVGTVLATLVYQTMRSLVGDTQRVARMALVPAALVGWEAGLRLIRQSVIALGVVATLDYMMQRHRHTKSLRMTKQEVREETKNSEGSPEVKAKIRRLAREMMRRRMLTAAKHATVVITNPTHYAIALEYRRAVMPAPRVVAKGKDLLAARIKDIAREHGVPIVENKPLAQALFHGAEVGDVIPAALFEAVAEVLAYLIRLKQLVL